MSDRNILFIVLDQWRADALGCAGNPLIRTPHLDSIAADGVLFARHFAQCAPCGPSRASLLTGQYQHNHGVMRNGTPLAARFTNLALECRKAGYEPALFGYTDTAVDPARHPPNDPALRSYEQVMPGFRPSSICPSVPCAGWRTWLHMATTSATIRSRPIDRPRWRTHEGRPTRRPDSRPNTAFRPS